MQFDEGVHGRRSIHGISTGSGSKEKITKIVDLARWAPSWGNTQPWELVIADGQKAKELADLFEEKAEKEFLPGLISRSDRIPRRSQETLHGVGQSATHIHGDRSRRQRSAHQTLPEHV